MLLWLEGAPVFNPKDQSTWKNLYSFIDQIVTVSDEDMPPELIDYRSPNECHFEIPHFPMDKTRILAPLDESFDQKNTKELKKTLAHINEVKNEANTLHLTFQQSLGTL